MKAIAAGTITKKIKIVHYLHEGGDSVYRKRLNYI